MTPARNLAISSSAKPPEGALEGALQFLSCALDGFLHGRRLMANRCWLAACKAASSSACRRPRTCGC